MFLDVRVEASLARRTVMGGEETPVREARRHGSGSGSGVSRACQPGASRPQDRVRALGTALAAGLAAGALAAAAAGAASAPPLACAVTFASGAVALWLGGVAPRRRRDAMERSASRTQARLEQEHHRLRSVVEELHDALIVVDALGVVILANPAARQLADVNGAVASRPLDEVLAGELGVRAGQAIDALKGQHGRDRLDLSRIRQGDQVYDLTASWLGGSGTGLGASIVILIRNSTQEFRTARTEDRFLSSISHELRTPLTNICAYAEILQHMLPGDSAEWPEFVQIIHTEGQRLSRVVDSVLDYVRLDTGRVAFRWEPIDVAEVAAQVRTTMLPVADRRSIELELVVDGDVQPVTGDRARLRQVMVELLDNAVKFTPMEGKVLLRVTAMEHHVRFCVEDSGPGIPTDQREAAFAKFYQLRDLLTEKPGGAGLGLSTCRLIVERLGGIVWCDESPLGGARFQVLLPVTHAAGPAPPTGEARVPGLARVGQNPVAALPIGS